MAQSVRIWVSDKRVAGAVDPHFTTCFWQMAPEAFGSHEQVEERALATGKPLPPKLVHRD